MKSFVASLFLALITASVAVYPALADDGDIAPGAPPDAITTPARMVGRTHDCRPFYPQASMIAGETGVVAFNYDVGADGVISNVVVLHRSGYPALDNAALQCVTERWRDTPALAGATPVASPKHLGVVMFDLRVDRDAQEFFEKGLDRVLTAKGDADLSTAIDNFGKAIEIDPDYRNAYYERGMAYRELGDTDRALADFSKARRFPSDLRIRPTPPPQMSPPEKPSDDEEEYRKKPD